MFRELHYSGVGFSLLLRSVTRGPLRGLAFTSWQGPIYFHFLEPIYQEHKAFRHLKKTIDLKTQIKTGGWEESVLVNNRSEITLFLKSNIFLPLFKKRRWSFRDAVTSAGENKVLSCIDDLKTQKHCKLQMRDTGLLRSFVKFGKVVNPDDSSKVLFDITQSRNQLGGIWAPSK